MLKSVYSHQETLVLFPTKCLHFFRQAAGNFVYTLYTRYILFCILVHGGNGEKRKYIVSLSVSNGVVI